MTTAAVDNAEVSKLAVDCVNHVSHLLDLHQFMLYAQVASPK
jgi:hypothetical protein